MRLALIIILAIAFLPIDSALAGPGQEPTTANDDHYLQVHPADLSLPGIIIEQVTLQLQNRIEAQFNAYLQLKMMEQEKQLLKTFGAGSDVRFSDASHDARILPEG